MAGLHKQLHMQTDAPSASKLMYVGTDPGSYVMHKLAHLIYGVINTGKPFDPNYSAKRNFIQDGMHPR